MLSTTTINVHTKLTGRIIGTHQQIDQVARKLLMKELPRHCYFPKDAEIRHFEGVRGPDGLKKKSPGIDEPSTMLGEYDDESGSVNPSEALGHENLDTRSVMTLIRDHRFNLVQALKKSDHVRAAFEAAWMAHMITDGLTPAHHFPLSKVKDELMTDKELVRVFGTPIKGLVHGRSMLETLRNNWLFLGANGPMTQHFAYECGVLMLTTSLPNRVFMPKLEKKDFSELDFEKIFNEALQKVQSYKMYERFCEDGWTTDLALDTKNLLLPEIVKCVTLGWHSAAKEAYHVH